LPPCAITLDGFDMLHSFVYPARLHNAQEVNSGEIADEQELPEKSGVKASRGAPAKESLKRVLEGLPFATKGLAIG
jgi:hypothetical protein